MWKILTIHVKGLNVSYSNGALGEILYLITTALDLSFFILQSVAFIFCQA